MDEIKCCLTEELEINARKSFSKIANKAGVSVQTIINRYNEMKDNDEIKFCSIVIDLTKMGYIGSTHILLNFLPSADPSEVIDEISKLPEIIIASTALGDYEGYVVSVFKNVEDIGNQIQRIKKIKGIFSVDFFLGLPGLKYFPPSEKHATFFNNF